MERIKKDGTQDLSSNKLTRAYDFDEQDVLKWISDKYIIGSYDDTTYAMMESYTLARIFSQFKKWLPDKVNNYFGSRIASDVGGKYVVKKTESGEKQVVWEKRVQEGIFVTLWGIKKDIKEANMLSAKGWAELPAYKRRNYTKALMDGVMFGALYGLYTGLTSDWDDEDPIVKDSRLMRVFKYGAMDIISSSPLVLSETLAQPAPVFTMVDRWMSIFTGDFSQIERNIPGAATITSTAEILSEE